MSNCAKLKCIQGLFLVFIVFASEAFGCLYTVRDLGFANIGSVPYRLNLYIRDDTPKNIIETFQNISYASLKESNIEVITINVDQEKNHPALNYLQFWELKSFPSAILVSPDARSLIIPVYSPPKPFNETVLSAVENIVISRKRSEILQNIVQAYCVILLIEGKNSAENQKAIETVTSAKNEIERVMNQMIRPVGKPPYILTISKDVFSREKILLWSLGITGNDLHDPHVFMLYGRGRRMFSALSGENITRGNVYGILSLIGASCECGLDREQLLGTMIPLRWDSGIQSRAAKHLGFDTENPMVKTEMSQILSLRPISNTGGIFSTSQTGAYNESFVELKSGSAGEKVSPAQLQKMSSTEQTQSSTRSPLHTAAAFACGTVILIGAAGIVILAKARRKKS